jgi:hypothetical protein
MSLLRLLTAGKSLIGIENSERRFRMSHPGAMPKFGNNTSFRTETPQAPIGATAEAFSTALTAQVERAVHGNVERAKGSDSEQVEHPGNIETGARQVPPGVEPGMTQKGVGAWVGNWGAKLISLAPRRRARPVNAPVRRNEAPLQGELSLDNIRVLRNDLSETDLEVVTGKRPETAPAAGLAGEVSLERARPHAGEAAIGKRRSASASGTIRGRVAMLFGTGKT